MGAVCARYQLNYFFFQFNVRHAMHHNSISDAIAGVADGEEDAAGCRQTGACTVHTAHTKQHLARQEDTTLLIETHGTFAY